MTPELYHILLKNVILFSRPVTPFGMDRCPDRGIGSDWDNFMTPSELHTKQIGTKTLAQITKLDHHHYHQIQITSRPIPINQ